MPRVKIRSDNNKDPRRKSALLNILSRHDVFITKLIIINDGYVVITSNEQDMDNIFHESTSKDLQDNDFFSIIPPELQASRSIIIPRVDPHIYTNDTEDIRTEVEEKNPWTVNQIASVFKFPNVKIIKITFKQSNFVKKAQQDGLKMFMMSIPSYQAIKQEIYYNVKICFRCYALEDHNTNQCDKSQEYKICSECAEYGHIWKDCSKNIFKCINCSGDHRTLASKCPRRKEIIKNKRHSDQVPKQTYSQAAQQQTSPSFTSPQNIPNNNETYTKIYTCIMHAHLQNIAEPGTYEEELNNMLKRNNLPEIKAPSNPPSGKILANLSAPTNNNYTTPDEEQTQQQIDEITTQDMQDHHCSHTTASSQEPTPAASAKAPTPIISRIKARHIGLKIYTTHSKGWPKKT